MFSHPYQISPRRTKNKFYGCVREKVSKTIAKMAAENEVISLSPLFLLNFIFASTRLLNTQAECVNMFITICASQNIKVLVPEAIIVLNYLLENNL